MYKPGIPQGTRDFSAETVQKRNYILQTIKNVFELFGFQPLETPAMENLETLMGKYGEEGDKLIFKILNNGLSDPKNIDKAKAGFEKLLEGRNTVELTERALKYDLTIPFARYVAMNYGQLTFPFKRYQVQPVWRADRPQKGRYREFTQCDADVVGSTSLINEIELVNIYHTVFTKLGLAQYELKINSRKILAALAEISGGIDKMTDITIAIDKIDKIGIDKVKEELKQRRILEEHIVTIEKYLHIDGTNEDKLKAVTNLFQNNETAKNGIDELNFILTHSKNINLSIDFTLARGLNYYTGTILEAKAPAHVKMGSIGGGGRYDDLTGLFAVPGIAGVGISFGVDRIYDVLEELKLFPQDLQLSTKVLFFNMGKDESLAALPLMQALRHSGISCELYHEPVKMDKQFKYADKKNIPFIIIYGSNEIATNEVVIKNLKTGHQQNIALKNLPSFLFN
ncbi:MAG: histidine--tRNA ligase [Bacteroidetes bacterium]|nr:histidine--tRNA ligase [Bacteroidota bacterium]MBS1756713.1 histidine--tRNA ligase [Bacteroidota bacterium]